MRVIGFVILIIGVALVVENSISTYSESTSARSALSLLDAWGEAVGWAIRASVTALGAILVIVASNDERDED